MLLIEPLGIPIEEVRFDVMVLSLVFPRLILSILLLSISLKHLE